MARRGATLQIDGMREVKRNLAHFLPREAKNILRRTVTKVAANIRKDMRQEAPKDEGTLRRAIVSRRMRGTPDSVEAGVYITHGKGVKNDAWYWHMVEWGTVKTTAQAFVTPTVEKWRPKVSAAFRHELGPQIEREMRKRARRQRK